MQTETSLSNVNLLNMLQDALLRYDERIERVCLLVDSVALSVATVKKHIGEEIHFMFKNKLGFTKDQAQKLFYDYKNKGKQDPGENNPKEPSEQPADDKGNVEQKISMIMNYMQETSTKLDQIEKDISYLKEQVDRILQKI